MHHAAIFLSSASGDESSEMSEGQRLRGSRLLALSRFSISCSKLSKATSLSGRERSDEVERIADMDSFIKSASLGPPIRAFMSSGSRVLWIRGVSSVPLVPFSWGLKALGSEFLMPHWSILFRFGSMVGLFGVWLRFVLWSFVLNILCIWLKCDEGGLKSLESLQRFSSSFFKFVLEASRLF